MYPIFGRFGPYLLYSYHLVMGLALAAAVGLTAALARRHGWQRPGWVDGLLVALFGGLLGGRAFFVWANWSYFQAHQDEIVLVWWGGLSYHGLLMAGLAALWLWSRWRGAAFGDYAGLLAPALALGSASGWLACWLEGCAYGRETTIGLLAADLPDSYGVDGLRYQTQLIGLLLSLLALTVSLWAAGRLRPWLLFWATLALLSGGRLLVSLMRGDAGWQIGRWRADSLVDGGLALLALAVSLSLVRRPARARATPGRP